MVELAGSGDMVGVNAGELLTAAATDELLMAAPVQSKRQKIVKKRYKATLIHSMHINKQFYPNCLTSDSERVYKFYTRRY